MEAVSHLQNDVKIRNDFHPLGFQLEIHSKTFFNDQLNYKKNSIFPDFAKLG